MGNIKMAIRLIASWIFDKQFLRFKQQSYD
jgi:hypothetical protein